MDSFISEISLRVFSQNGLIALLFTIPFVLFIWKGIPAMIKRDDMYISLLIEKFSSEIGLGRIAHEKNMEYTIDIFAKGIATIREDGRDHKGGIKELRQNQINIEAKVDRLVEKMDRFVDKK